MVGKLALLQTVDMVWAIEPGRAEGYMAALEAMDPTAGAEMASVAGRRCSENISELAKANDGILYLTLSGPMTKAMTSATWMLGGTSTLQLRRMLVAAKQNDEVKGVFLYIDAPGGQLAGTEELAEDIASCASKKPVMAFISDMCCSAAYWAASQATVIVAEPGSSAIGNIGTYMVAYDQSKRFADKGIEVILFATGPHKGAGALGVEITDDQRSEFQSHVDRCQVRFESAVKSGRGLDSKQYSAVSDGRYWNAEESLSLGLIDACAREEEAYQMLLEQIQSDSRAPAAQAAEVDKTMSKDTQKPSLVERVRGLIGTASGGSTDPAAEKQPETPSPDQSVLAEAERLRAEASAARAETAKILESRLESDASAYAESLFVAGKILPAQKESVAENYVRAVLSDSPGGIKAAADGSISTGQSVAAMKSMMDSFPDLKLTKEQVAANATEGVVVLPSDPKPDKKQAVDSFLAQSSTGQKALAARGQN